MRQFRLLIIALATICVLALGVFAFVSGPQGPPAPADDDIIIKGGSLEIDCGRNHGEDCLAPDAIRTKYKHKQATKKITMVTVRDQRTDKTFFTSSFDPANQPQIEIRYK